MKKLPLIELLINPEDNSFVSAVALVENPAIESDFIAFSKDTAIEKFSINEERKELLGAAMIPDVPIYRNSEQNGEYMATFSKETIRQIAQVFAQKGLFNNTNIEHTLVPAESLIFQSYITDQEKGINAPKGVDCPDGSWIIGVKILNDSVWQNIKAGKIKGFSVEGIFKAIDTQTTVNLSKANDFDIAIDDVIASIDELVN
ncbi:XkdF-like putative serine protease domain-containing protein [Mucilaginibacter sp. UR6-1]|uniref:XkdF-like putative serine protease domain-containing protein n=1 Tax=Mucilaginibacter sp. UR6-1 TaxID=1435643 RepID=UPI001E63E6CD|nr:XkdF-like putative serine protease domain-containing protein [Mucilaginibacter sp. UR6-1]MCC8409915.1 XkdF-like putative serine protease domain-containing protein [Mucilaginibacter sp. UR6-1]